MLEPFEGKTAKNVFFDVRRPFLVENKEIKYEGSFDDGKFSGEGRLEQFSQNQVIFGTFSLGQIIQGTFTRPGLTYTEAFLNGVFHGQGASKDSNQELSGDFENGKFISGVATVNGQSFNYP